MPSIKPKTSRGSVNRPPPKARLRPLTAEELKRPGVPLMAALVQVAIRRGLTRRAIAQEALGISESYFHALRTGKKSIPQLRDAAVEQAARYLQVPKILAMVLAGQLHPEDFHANYPKAENLTSALQFIMRTDPQLGVLMPPNVFSQKADIQFSMVKLYERATGLKLIPERDHEASLPGA